MKLTDEELTGLLSSMELEEPSMSFTRNVMEQVKLEIQPVALKTKVDKRIINSIAAIFIVAIITLVGYAIVNSNFSYSLPRIKFKIEIEGTIISDLIKAFIGVDLIIALLYFDRLLRRKSA